MTKVFQTFDKDIKREFNDVTTVDLEITALDIDEYIVTKNVEDILGCFLAYFFDDKDEYPNLQMKCDLLQDVYRDKVGPGVWIRGFFGSGKSHLIKVMNTLFSSEELPYIDENNNEKKLNVIENIQSKIRNHQIVELLGNINPNDYLTFIFSANHITKTGDSIIDCLPNEIALQIGMDYDEDKKHSARDVSVFLNKVLEQSGKKRMLIFIDEILDLLDDGDKVRKFEGLIEQLNNNIWFVVTSLEAKTKLLTTVTAERMIHRFGQEQILLPEEMVWIVKKRYLAKTEEGGKAIESNINIDKLKYHFSSAYLSDTEDGKIEKPTMIASYPFYPFQLAYMKELLKNESKGSARNMMRTVKSIIKDPEVYQKEVGYFVDINLIYEELKNKRSIVDEYSDLITSLEGTRITDDNNAVVDKTLLLNVLKSIVLLAQVKPEGSKDYVILPFVYDEDNINDRNILKYYLDILSKENYINIESGVYKPITKKESNVWTLIKNISSITESSVRTFINNKIYDMFSARTVSGKKLISGKINNFTKDIAFVLKQYDFSSEYPNVISCIPYENEIEKLKKSALDASSNKEQVYIIPDKQYDGEALRTATEFYLKMEEALNREADFGIDSKLRIQIETKMETGVNSDIDKMLEDCFENSTISYIGQNNKDVSTPVTTRVIKSCERMLKKKFSMFFGELLRESVDTFIKMQILFPKFKMTSDYLKKLDLLDKNGQVNISNRYYNEFLKSFPEGGFDRDGVSIIDEFSKGKYGWELDTIKILTALAVKNSDLKVARESRTYVLPDDIDELVANQGPFAARRRISFDGHKFTKINISDEELTKTFRTIKYIDANMTVEHKLKDLSQKAKLLLSRLDKINVNYIRNESLLESKYDDVNLFSCVNNKIKKMTDSEDIVLYFNSKISDDNLKDRLKHLIYISGNMDKLIIMVDAYKMIKQYLDDETFITMNKTIDSFLDGEVKAYDTIINKYRIIFRLQYNEYKKLYSEIVNSIKSLPEWNGLETNQKNDILKGINFINLNELIYRNLILKGIGLLSEINNYKRSLNESKSNQIRLVHYYNDINSAKRTKAQDPAVDAPKPNTNTTKPVSKEKRISRRFSSYSSGKVINLDSIEKIVELDNAFEEIKEKIKKDLKDGKKITLEL